MMQPQNKRAFSVLFTFRLEYSGIEWGSLRLPLTDSTAPQLAHARTLFRKQSEIGH